jgi:23S rRNA pseudouridine1911/1915/1917 synthase
VVAPEGAVRPSDAQLARLSYRVLARLSVRRSLLEVRLETGRKHQIRLQLAHRGYPIEGDAKYGASSPFPAGIALHARRLGVRHPTLKTPLSFTAPLPLAWKQAGIFEETVQKAETKPNS